MKRLLVLFALIALFAARPAWALTDEEDSVSCWIPYTASVGWSACSNGPFSALTLSTADLWGEIKFLYLEAVYSGDGIGQVFNCGIKYHPRTVTITGWQLAPVVGSPGHYDILFHVTATSGCLTTIATGLKALLLVP